MNWYKNNLKSNIVDQVMGQYKKKIEDLKYRWDVVNVKNDGSGLNFEGNQVLEVVWNEEQLKLAKKFQKTERILDAKSYTERKRTQVLNEINDKDQRKYKLMKSMSQTKKKSIEEKQKEYLDKLNRVKDQEKAYFTKLRNEEMQMTKKFKKV